VIILGTKPAQHDACFAIVRDGQPLFIYEQERFNRIKHGMSSDLSVLFDALAEYSIRPQDIDLVTNCIDPTLLGERKKQARTYLKGPAVAAMDEYLEWRIPMWRRVLVAAGFPEDRIIDVRHHICHCAGVYLSIDGGGETETAMMAHGAQDRIEILRTTSIPQSVGLFYQACTFWLGWGFGEEGKTMALAAYGDPNRYRERLADFLEIDDDGDFRFIPLEDSGQCAFSSEELKEYVFTRFFGPSRTGDESLTGLHKDVAAAVQSLCERVVMNSATYLRDRTRSRNLLLTGGVGLNSVSNGMIMKARLFDRVVAYPQANDTGTALGGALYAYHSYGPAPKRRSWHMTHAYFGKMIDTENAARVAAEYGVRGVRETAVHETAAELLAAGQILGWVQGRSEVGPRALGNRSILGNPLVSGIKDLINAGIKHRESWRPFAPSVRREDLTEYFEADQDLPYMTVVAPIRDVWRDRLASVGHVDGTARVQTVTEESNPLFYALLTAFKQRTGLGVLLNTSFNDRGEPLVQTCAQAMRLFQASAMDALFLGDWVFTEKSAVRPRPFAAYYQNFAKLPRSRLLLLRSEGQMPSGMLAHLLEVCPDLTIEATVGEGAAAIFPEAERHRALKHAEAPTAIELGTQYDGVLCYIGRPGDRFIFDKAVYHSKLADESRALLEAGIPVYWIDSAGDVTEARNILYVHHERAGCRVPSSYERYWTET